MVLAYFPVRSGGLVRTDISIIEAVIPAPGCHVRWHYDGSWSACGAESDVARPAFQPGAAIPSYGGNLHVAHRPCVLLPAPLRVSSFIAAVNELLEGTTPELLVG